MLINTASTLFICRKESTWKSERDREVLFLYAKLRKRDRCSERIFDADIYADSSYCARLYHLAVEEPEALQRCKQQGNDDSLKSKTV